MDGAAEQVRRGWRRGPVVVLTLAASTIALLAVMSLSALAYGSSARDGDGFLPGTTIATVAVGDRSIDDARTAIAAHLDAQLSRTITVTAADRTWTTTPAELGASTDLDRTLEDAAARAADLHLTDLVRLRWLGAGDDLAHEVTTTIPDGEVAAFVATIADEVDRAPRDAEVAWSDGAVVVTIEGQDGRTVVRDEAVAAVLEAAAGTATEIELPVETTAPQVTTGTATEVADAVGARVDLALDRPVTVTLADRTEARTGRDLGAQPDIEPLVAAALAGDDLEGLAPALDIGGDRIAEVVDAVAAGTATAPKDATLDVSGGGFRVTPEVTGAAVHRADAIARVQAAFDGADDVVTLELAPVRPAITAADFDRVLVVDHSATTLTLYQGGAPGRSWPVAIGTNNSPTPLGQFVVGAKRYEPTWVNPARDRWGKDMPERIGPGPTNPLGARAINWNTTAGNDTLIRFHGTPNEASIGTASSNGCVRMFNADVIELYDLIDTGTVIVSTP